MESTGSDYQIAARIERLPLSTWHLKILIPIGTGWFFDAHRLSRRPTLSVLLICALMSLPNLTSLPSGNYFAHMSKSGSKYLISSRIEPHPTPR